MSEADELAEVAALIRHPGWEFLVGRVLNVRERYFARFARGLMTQKGPVDQREVDYKRGYWEGAVWAVQTLPLLTSRQYERYVEDALKEAEKVV